MVGIVGIGGLPESYATSTGGPRTKATSTLSPSNSQDVVNVSEEAKLAAEMKDYVTAAASDPVVRKERVEEARKRIEEGTDRMNDVLRLVAGRVNRYVGFEASGIAPK